MGWDHRTVSKGKDWLTLAEARLQVIRVVWFIKSMKLDLYGPLSLAEGNKINCLCLAAENIFIDVKVFLQIFKKYSDWGWAFGIVVKSQLGMSTSHIGVPGWTPGYSASNPSC